MRLYWAVVAVVAVAALLTLAAAVTETCSARIFVAYPDGIHVVGCSAIAEHPLTHTAYHGDRLHQWTDTEEHP